MAFRNPIVNLVIPAGATTGDRIEIGTQIPADLQAYFQSGAFTMIGSNIPAGFPFTVAAVILFWDSLGNYSFEALVEGTNGVIRLAYVVYGNQISGVFTGQEGRAIVAPAGGPSTVLNGSDVAADRLDIVNALTLLTGSQSSVLGALLVTDAGSLVGVDGGGLPETWHAVAFANGWANSGGGAASLKYRKTALREVQMIGTITSPNPFNSVIGTLPVGYRPTNQQGIWAWTNNGSGQLVRVDSGGQLVAFGDGAITHSWWINGTFSLEL